MRPFSALNNKPRAHESNHCNHNESLDLGPKSMLSQQRSNRRKTQRLWLVRPATDLETAIPTVRSVAAPEQGRDNKSQSLR